ncbi:competence type IV pilus minor pilin ComGD [Neobacillus sp. D3-1R]|uniref:competence type IV pilus minor pilin ComGD n=1 Tax=Neobacillus sp. D3-1R TaxID=3445778 RepID=UPI003F9ECDD6
MDNKGFTLIESLIVFSMVAIISTGTLFFFKPHQLFFEKKLFLSQLLSDFYIAQQYAISHQREITVSIIPEQQYYYIRERYDSPIIIERNYSERIKIKPGSLPLSFKFLPNGNASQIGVFYIRIGDKSYQFTMQLGKGRFYIVDA